MILKNIFVEVWIWTEVLTIEALHIVKETKSMQKIVFSKCLRHNKVLRGQCYEIFDPFWSTV